MRMALKQALDKEKTEFQTEFQPKTFQILPTSGTKELISFKPAVVDEWNMCNDRLPEYHCDLLPRIMCIWKNKQKHKFIDKKGTSVVIFGDCCRHIINTYKCWPTFSSFNTCPSYPGYQRFFFACSEELSQELSPDVGRRPKKRAASRSFSRGSL